MPHLRARRSGVAGARRNGATTRLSEPTYRRPPARGFQRLALQLPRRLYVGPLAELMRSRCVLLLTTRGRRSGLPRTTALSFMPTGDRLVVFSGWGTASAWYQNVLAHPEVRVQIGRRRLRATARLVEDPARRAELMRQMSVRSAHCGPPRPVRPLLKLSGIFDYQRDIDLSVAAGGTLPVIEISPSAR